MKKSGWVKGSIAAGVVLIAISFALSANARVIGYTEDTENFPNMLEEHPSCSKTYQDYLFVAKKLNACDELKEAKTDLTVQQALSKHMGEMKGCRSCQKAMVQADEAAAAYKEQINIYKPQCPNTNQHKWLTDQVSKKEKAVCKSCYNKWPGKVGPIDGKSPCK
ncbi:MAG: hypothetical protein ABH871_02265 [Pseudomonadota bacterium]